MKLMKQELKLSMSMLAWGQKDLVVLSFTPNMFPKFNSISFGHTLIPSICPASLPSPNSLCT